MALREIEYVTEARAAAKQLWDAVHKLKALQSEYVALDYGNTLEVPQDGGHAGISAADIGSAVFGTTDAVLGLFAGGHATNLAKLL